MLIVLLLGAAVAVYVGAGRRSRRPAPKYRYCGMLLLVGVPGSGKTYKMLHLMLQRLAEGRDVRVNFNVRYDRVYWALQRQFHLTREEARAALTRITYLDSFEDFVDAYDCDVFIDEAQDVCNSTDWQMFPHEVVTWFAQHRHRRCRIVMASHRFGSIHNYVRELLAQIELARPAPWFTRAYAILFRRGLPLLQYINIKEPDEEVTSKPNAKARKGFSMMFALSLLAVDPIVGNCYDTHGGVRPSPMAALRRKRAKSDEEVLVLKPRLSNTDVSRPSPLDDQPYLALPEWLEAVQRGMEPGAELATRWA